MKITTEWLKEWVKPTLSTAALAEQLTMAGLEVDAVHPAAGDFSSVLVGHVVARDKHPDADKLSCCKVDVGAGELLDIVCGAANVRADLKVAVAVVGAVLPGDFKIKKAKLRGQPSFGMICSASELGLGDGQDGIMELPQDAPIGADILDYLQCRDDHVIDIELTPNRGDCASMRGVAREVGVLNQLVVNGPTLKPVKPQSKETIAIQCDAHQACPRYVGRVIRGIDCNAVTPLWMQERLRRCGLRSIHPVVDVGNYVMLELGQPLHAFDLDCLHGGIQVRQAKAGESLTLLDGQTVTLDAETLVIADDQQPQAIAGVMGGEASAVSAATQHILLESAFFEPIGVRLTARRFQLQTESSYRFERGVDSELQVTAIERATELLLAITGGDAGPVIEVADKSHLPEIRQVLLRREQIVRLLGITVEDKQVVDYLQRLGMTVKNHTMGWQVSIPSYRFDIELEVDLIEELARIAGYDNIPTQQLTLPMIMPEMPEGVLARSALAEVLVGRGYYEAITYSFVDPALQQLLDPAQEAVALVNPLASDMSVMRTNLWAGLIQALQYNLNRQCPRVRLFETGLSFTRIDGEWQQSSHIAGVVAGWADPEQWSQKTRPVDFYDVKGDIEALLGLTRDSERFSWQRSQNPVLHPGQSADLYYTDQRVGQIGVLNPMIVQKLNMAQTPILFDVSLEALEAVKIPKFIPISKFPAVRRDLAIVVNKEVSARDIFETIRDMSGKLLKNLQIFDIYSGAGIVPDQHSIALGLLFQEPTRTLVDQEINDIIEGVLAALKQKYNATLRT